MNPWRKSSRRTLPLPDPVYEMLCEEREKQDLYRRMFKGSYNRKYDDYMLGLPLSAQYKSPTIS